MENKEIKKPESVFKKGYCGRCGRPLKSKVSIDRGYGAFCYKKVQEEKAKKIEEDNLRNLEGEVRSIDHSTDRTIKPRKRGLIDKSSKLKPVGGDMGKADVGIIIGDWYLRDIKSNRLFHQDYVSFENGEVLISDSKLPFSRYELLKGRDVLAEEIAI